MLNFKRVMTFRKSHSEEGARALTRDSMRSAEPSSEGASEGVTWRRQLNGVTQGQACGDLQRRTR